MNFDMNYAKNALCVPIVLALASCAPPGQGTTGFRDIDWPRSDHIMTPSENREIEVLLNQLGYLARGIDGQITVGTRVAIRQYQGDIGAPVTGFVSTPLLFSLRANAPGIADAPEAAASVLASPSPTPVRPITTSASDSRSSDRGDDDGDSGGLGGGSGRAWN